MDLTIYAYGNGATLASVFSAIASMVNQGLGGPVIGPMLAMAVLMLVMGVGGHFLQGGPDHHNVGSEISQLGILVKPFIYAAVLAGVFVAPRFDITINDRLDATQDGAVANVPAFAAVPLWLTGNVGIALTEALETTLSTVDDYKYSKAGFGYLHHSFLAAVDSELPDTPLKGNIDRYFLGCVLPMLVGNDPEMNKILKSTDLVGTLADYKNPALPVPVLDDSGQASSGTCSTLYDQISSQINSAKSDWHTQLKAVFGLRENDDVETATGSAIGLFLGANQEASAVLQTAAMYNQMKKSMGRWARLNGSSALIMSMATAEAQEREKTGRALGGKQIGRAFSHMYPFMQVAFLALTPILIVFSAYSGRILFSSMSIFAWLSLWDPMLCIINFQIHSIVSGYASTLGNICNSQGMCAANLLQAKAKVAEAMAFGQSLIDWVPMLSGVVIFGGVGAAGVFGMIRAGVQPTQQASGAAAGSAATGTTRWGTGQIGVPSAMQDNHDGTFSQYSGTVSSVPHGMAVRPSSVRFSGVGRDGMMQDGLANTLTGGGMMKKTGVLETGEKIESTTHPTSIQGQTQVTMPGYTMQQPGQKNVGMQSNQQTSVSAAQYASKDRGKQSVSSASTGSSWMQVYYGNEGHTRTDGSGSNEVITQQNGVNHSILSDKGIQGNRAVENSTGISHSFEHADQAALGVGLSASAGASTGGGGSGQGSGNGSVGVPGVKAAAQGQVDASVRATETQRKAVEDKMMSKDGHSAALSTTTKKTETGGMDYKQSTSLANEDKNHKATGSEWRNATQGSSMKTSQSSTGTGSGGRVENKAQQVRSLGSEVDLASQIAGRMTDQQVVAFFAQWGRMMEGFGVVGGGQMSSNMMANRGRIGQFLNSVMQRSGEDAATATKIFESTGTEIGAQTAQTIAARHDLLEEVRENIQQAGGNLPHSILNQEQRQRPPSTFSESNVSPSQGNTRGAGTSRAAGNHPMISSSGSSAPPDATSAAQEMKPLPGKLQEQAQDLITNYRPPESIQNKQQHIGRGQRAMEGWQQAVKDRAEAEKQSTVMGWIGGMVDSAANVFSTPKPQKENRALTFTEHVKQQQKRE